MHRGGLSKPLGNNHWLCIRAGYEITGSSLPGIHSVGSWLVISFFYNLLLLLLLFSLLLKIKAYLCSKIDSLPG